MSDNTAGLERFYPVDRPASIVTNLPYIKSMRVSYDNYIGDMWDDDYVKSTVCPNQVHNVEKNVIVTARINQDRESFNLHHIHWDSLTQYFKFGLTRPKDLRNELEITESPFDYSKYSGDARDMGGRDIRWSSGNRFSHQRNDAGNGEWNSPNGLNNCLKILPYWEDGRYYMTRKANELQADIGRPVPVKGDAYSYIGTSPAVPQYLQGLPKQYNASQLDAASEQVIRILVDLNIACGNGCYSRTCFQSDGYRPSPTMFAMRGTTIYLMALGLEEAGYKVEILGSMMTSCVYTSTLYQETISLKHHDEPVDEEMLEQLSIVLLNTAWNNRFVFMGLENLLRYNLLDIDNPTNYGNGELSNRMPRAGGGVLPLPRKYLDFTTDEDTIVMPNMVGWNRVFEPATMVQDMVASLSKYGVGFE